MQHQPHAEAVRAASQHLRSIPPRARTVDEARSLQFLDTEEALLSGAAPDGAGQAVIRWVLRLHEVEAFVAEHRRLPTYNRRRKGELDPYETRLEGWLRTQRAAHETLSSYQQARLDSIPGFAWRVRDAQWSATLQSYRAYLIATGSAPRERSHDPREEALASWAVKQRQLRRRGRLSQDRERQLEALPIWTW